MFSLIHGVFAVAHMGLVAWGVTQYRRQANIGLLILIAMAAGLVYDNVAVGLGSTIGVGGLLQNLSIPRYVIHAFLTPLLIVTGYHLARQAGVPWAQGENSHRAIWAIGGGLVLVGIWQSLWGLHLHPACFADTVRYAETVSATQVCSGVNYAEGVVGGRSGGPPLASISTVIIVIVQGIAVWRHAGWPWMAIGGVVMFVAAAMPVSRMGLWLSNGGELVLLASLMATFQVLAKRMPTAAVLVAAD